jgi:hypothetical protein
LEVEQRKLKAKVLIFITTGGANYMKAWVDWNNNRIFDESTEVVYQCTNAFINTFGFKIPETTTPGNYRIKLELTNQIQRQTILLEHATIS